MVRRSLAAMTAKTSLSIQALLSLSIQLSRTTSETTNAISDRQNEIHDGKRMLVTASSAAMSSISGEQELGLASTRIGVQYFSECVPKSDKTK